MEENTIELTSRLKKVLTYICQGYTAVKIAKKLKISHSTVRNDISALFKMTKTKTPAHLVYQAVKKGLIA